jgi:serine protease Do
MDRLILRHLRGARAHQEIAISRAEFETPITLGRDPSCRVAFDESDETVSRQHARLERAGAGWRLIDTGSANGLWLRGERVVGERMLRHGDELQLGQGGPILAVLFDPPPPEPKATRLVDAAALRPAPAGRAPGPQPTRLETPSMPASMPAPVPSSNAKDPAVATAPAAAGAPDAPRSPGRATVERLIGQQMHAEQRRSTRRLVNAVAGVAALAIGIGAWQFHAAQQGRDQIRQEAQARIDATREEADRKLADVAARADLPARVKAAYAASTVYIETSWRLTSSANGRQIYHQRVVIDDKGTALPAYIKVDDERYEPLLTTDDSAGARPIAGSHGGTGFVVSEKGLIMTNRHVAAAWHAPFELPFPGVVVESSRGDQGGSSLKPVEVLRRAPESLQNWVPARSRLVRSKGVNDSQSTVTGHVNLMTVTFANSHLRVPATLGTISPEHDVALIRIDAGDKPLKRVEMRDSYDTLASGDPIVALGYPGVSAKSYLVTNSQDQFVAGRDVAVVPDVSVSQGIVSKVVRTRRELGQERRLVSTSGDVFEMSINSAGQGNSGGPVFDRDGKVIGIFSLIGTSGQATITGATPIRYGLALLDPTQHAVASR